MSEPAGQLLGTLSHHLSNEEFLSVVMQVYMDTFTKVCVCVCVFVCVHVHIHMERGERIELLHRAICQDIQYLGRFMHS